MQESWASLQERIGELESLQEISGVLSWDQQTMMPAGGAAARGRHLALVGAMSHDKLVDAAVGDWLSDLEAHRKQLSPVQAASVRKIRRMHERARRVPTSLVREMAEAGSTGFAAWHEAKKTANFELFQPSLTRIVDLVRQTAACHGPAAHPYDHLLEEYDPGSTVAELQPMFDRLGAELTPFVQAVTAAPAAPRLGLDLDVAGIQALGKRVIAALGFRSEDGRLDESEHPFTVGICAHDVRLTTHSYADDLLGSLTGTIHECGHGLYEQGLPDDMPRTGVATAAGMGLHESQSRFWENVIGRSRPFFTWLTPLVQAQWPGLDVDAERLFRAANRVERSFVRIKADEATYNLHIILRFKLELALMSGDLEVAELPQAWDALSEELLGVRPPDATQGLLQDVHWSGGYFGYFPSYTIGNLYAAGFARAMEDDLPQMWQQVEEGDFASVLGWLRDKVHSRGHLADAPTIFRQAVGDRDPVADLMAHLRERQG